MDSRRGSELYKFDMSLMERLSSSGFPMSQIDVQRRMRPEISNLIRSAAVRTLKCTLCSYNGSLSETLYPRLIDHDIVKEYPNVRGFTKNVFFFNHNHKENGGSSEETTSKFNMFEVTIYVPFLDSWRLTALLGFYDQRFGTIPSQVCRPSFFR